MAKPLRYRCLILDHDDTVVASTPAIHFPAYLETMAQLRPGMKPLSLEEFFLMNFDPGFSEYMTGQLGMRPEEMAEEVRIWRGHSTVGKPRFFPGIVEFLKEFRNSGGLISVVSHSEIDIILGNYRDGTAGVVEPDLVFGWDADSEKRKPHPWPVQRTLERLHLSREDVLVVDDLKPGVLMARAAGVAVAAAGWGHSLPRIRAEMEQCCDAYLESVDALRGLAMG